jgi:hypothetical protein
MEKLLVNIDSRLRDISLFPNSNYFKLEYNDSVVENDYKNNTKVNYKYKNNNYINLKNVDYITLSSFEIINNIYVFQEERFNISFVVTPHLIGDQEALPPLTVTISPGNYTYAELINNLNTAMNDLNLYVGTDNNGTLDVTDGLQFSINTSTNIITLTNHSTNYKYTVNFDNEQYDYVSLGYMLGFRKNLYTLTATQTDPVFINGDAPADINGEKYIFLRINDYGSVYISPKLPYKVLGKIILDTKQGFIFNNGQDLIYKTYKFRQPSDVKSLEIELLDYNGNRLNINGIDYSFTLEFGMIYDEEIYKKKLFSLNLSSDWPSNDMFNGYDTTSNIHSIETPSNKTTAELLESVFKNKVEIKSVDEMENKKAKKKSKNKFNIVY